MSSFSDEPIWRSWRWYKYAISFSLQMFKRPTVGRELRRKITLGHVRSVMGPEQRRLGLQNNKYDYSPVHPPPPPPPHSGKVYMRML